MAGYTFVALFTTLIGIWLLSVAYGLLRNHQRAHKLGMPVIHVPVSFFNPLWAFSQPLIQPYLLKLPLGFDRYFRYIGIDWATRERRRVHEKYGDIFAVVNPKDTIIFVGEAAAIDEGLGRRKDFTKPKKLYGAMDFFGENVDTVEGATWQRHRKITTPPFNERNSGLVWKESIKQAQQMLQTWTRQGKPTRSTTGDNMTLALHVLTAAGFGQSYDFSSHSQVLPKGHNLSYRDALNKVVRSFLILAVFNHDLLLSPWMPSALNKVGLAAREFRLYMAESIERERQLISQRSPESYNLISSLIRASEDGKAELSSLSADEITGNLFIYNLAGHETTANTLSYAFYLLAIHPYLQDWVHGEITQVIGTDSSLDLDAKIEKWVYHEAFPRLKRTLAVMYETLRFYQPLTAVPRWTGDCAQPITVGGKTYAIPARTYVVFNTSSAHADPQYWGKNALNWDPTRWIDSPIASSNLDAESLRFPDEKGAYRPWLEGPRVCPGKKFAQVEFVAVLATLFRDWTVSVTPETKRKSRPTRMETEQEVKDRVLGVLEDSRVRITLQMQRPEKVGLVWQRRGQRRGE